MQISDAQREVRTVFLGGAVGQTVSGGLWLLSSALSTWVSVRQGIMLLVIGGAFIFPLTMLLLRLMGLRSSLSDGNPMGQLATQVAFTIPVNLLVVGAATLYRINLFYPACMVVVGAHYFPFVFLYGMWQFWVLGALMVGVGAALPLLLPASFSAGGWITAVLLLVFALVGWTVTQGESRAGAS